jgi:tetratricopeptide (TPR) repeat protein
MPARLPYVLSCLAAVAFVALVLLPMNLRQIRAQVWKRQADELTAAGRTQEATEALREACRLVPGERTYHVSLAASILAGESVQVTNAEELRAAFRASEKELLRAGALDPGDVRTYWPLGQLYQYWGMLDRAKYTDGERVYRRAAALSPRRQRTYWAWGDLLLGEGKRTAALERYQYALALDPTVIASKRALAKLYVRLGQPEQAEPLFADAWKRMSAGPLAARDVPARAAEQEMLGLAYLSRGQKARARAYLTGALSLNPQLSQAREALERISKAGVPG